MTRIEEIEHAVAELPKEELARFREWFAEFEARVWDHEIEQDIEADSHIGRNCYLRR